MNLISSIVLTITTLASGATGLAPHATPSTTEPDTVPATSTASDESGPTAGRPQFHLGDSEARRTRIQVAYNECLLANGAQENTGREGVAMAAAPGEDAQGNPVGPLVLEPVPASASAACLTSLPVMPPQVSASTNPDFTAQAADYVACMQDQGLYVRLLNDHDLDWTYRAGHPVPDDEPRIEDDCLISAFAG
jgi:hypothetical protein